MHYTPPAIHRNIDFVFFRKIDSAFVSGRFGVSFSDILYETRLTTGAPVRLIFLFEHKSYLPSLPIHLQLLDYMLQLWEDDIKNKRPISIIVPIVVYHGEKGWIQRPFSEYFHGIPEDWLAFIPSFHYWLTDLSRMPEQTIEEKPESTYLSNLFLALKSSRDKKTIQKNLKKIITFGETSYPDDRTEMLFQSLVFYIIKITDMTQREFKDVKQQQSDHHRKIVEIAREIFGDEIPRFLKEEWKEQYLKEWKEQYLKEGLDEGRKEGIEKGRKEGIEGKAREFTINTIHKFPNWSDEEIAELVGVKKDFVQKIRLELQV